LADWKASLPAEACQRPSIKTGTSSVSVAVAIGWILVELRVDIVSAKLI
jgi:hypothetical protein